jgi:hypothetical protein
MLCHDQPGAWHAEKVMADICMPSLLASLYDGNLIYSPHLKKDAEDLSKFKYIST